jgi:hypothetical protein
MSKIENIFAPCSMLQGWSCKFVACSLWLVASLLLFTLCISFAQGDDIEYTFDTTSNVSALPKIFSPNIDLSGRGFHSDVTWPQSQAAGEVLDSWQKKIGFLGLYRMQYNLWEISQLAKDKASQEKLLANYDAAIKRISDAGGIVILNIFSTPQGLGKVLDKKSSPADLKFFKELIKNYIRELSCNKRYNIWYEVWSAPDLDDFFLGRQQEYLNLYKAVAESVKELEEETKVHIPVGGPSVSSWFRDFENNTIITPERSIIYELIKFCYHYKLPLNFISWHAYSTDPKIEKEITRYNKTSAALIRNWLSYFSFEKDTPLIVDEWNYDSGTNILAERKEKAYISASYIPSRIKNMYEAGIDYQLFFSLEDFQDNKEGVVRNVGIFWLEQYPSGYKGGPKSLFNVFQMLNALGKNLLLPQTKLNDEFVGVIVTKKEDDYAVLIYNYIDPDIARNYLSRNIALLNDGERKSLLAIIKSDRLARIMRKELDISSLRLTNKVKNFLKKAQEANDYAEKFKSAPRNLNFTIKNLKDDYFYQIYSVDESCNVSCDFAPIAEKEIAATDVYQEKIVLKPYSVNLIVLKKKPKELEKPKESQQLTEPEKVVQPQPPQEALKEKESAQPAEAEKPKETEQPKEAQKPKEADKLKEAEQPKETEKIKEPASVDNFKVEKQAGNVTKEIDNIIESPASAEKAKDVTKTTVEGEE